MKTEDVTIDIVKEAAYGCICCEDNGDPCVNGSLFEPHTTMSGHPSCMGFEYNGLPTPANAHYRN